jgi:hypothetical protein
MADNPSGTARGIQGQSRTRYLFRPVQKTTCLASAERQAMTAREHPGKTDIRIRLAFCVLGFESSGQAAMPVHG